MSQKPNQSGKQKSSYGLKPTTCKQVTFVEGQLVWARFSGLKWWAGIVIEKSSVIPVPDASLCVFWFGDHKISAICKIKIAPFKEDFMSKYQSNSGKTFSNGVAEALQECASRNGIATLYKTNAELLDWAMEGFPTQNRFVDLPKGQPLPDYVVAELHKISERMRKSGKGDQSPAQEETTEMDGVKAVKSGRAKMTEICIVCNTMDFETSVTAQHPFFKGGLCQTCHVHLKELVFTMSDDGTYTACSICCDGGDLFICEAPSCKRVFCFTCIKLFDDEKEIRKIANSKSWLCYLCTPSYHCGILKVRQDWRRHLSAMFDSEYRLTTVSCRDKTIKRPIRVLSLFDGLGTGKLVLDQLGIDVDIYLSSEIDEAAMLITNSNHPTVMQVGDILEFTTSAIKKFCPIDLVIGAAPYFDFTLENKERMGFGGSALLFYDFLRVLDDIQCLCSEDVFWMFENVACMNTEHKTVLSRFLEREPALWNANYFCSQHKARYFWGNIPGMYSTKAYSELVKTPEVGAPMLDPPKTPEVGATMLDPPKTNNKESLTTESTTSHINERQTRCNSTNEDGDRCPEEDPQWMTNLEKECGFPDHYTKVGNLSLKKRNALIEQAWNIPVLKHLLFPLCSLFSVKQRSTE